MIEKDVLEQLIPGAKIRLHDTKTGQFEGIVLARKHGMEPGATFTVRATVAGVGVEKVYPIYSPSIKDLKILHSPKKMKRSKLYYLRNLSAKAVRRKIGVR
ncbi:MAG: 50S ribosomal protein L19 [bacterium]